MLITSSEDYLRKDVKFARDPILTTINFYKEPLTAGKWALLFFTLSFDSKYYDSGYNTFDYIISSTQNENDNVFTDNSQLVKNINDNTYLFIPNTLTDGTYYIIARGHYVDGSNEKVSNILSKSVTVKRSSMKNEINAELDQSKRVLRYNDRVDLKFTFDISIPYARILFKVGDYTTEISDYNLVVDLFHGNEESPRIQISYDQSEIQHKLSFVLIDKETSNILNHTEITDLTIIPKFEIEDIQYDNPKYDQSSYLVQSQDVVSGTVTCKNQVAIEHLSIKYSNQIGTITAIPGESKKFKFKIDIQFEANEMYIDLNFIQNSETVDKEFGFRILDMTININKDLPLSGTVAGSVKISNNINSEQLKICAKFGEYD
ncbi:hypothetical protein TVAG_148120 [Trichomonas vaginalis G3]|uniref:Uncharacterized protein n=1 Tax=Trichomonas vaginalis (strain ATCC PRA-98 / G3) TaxID=412133 RepID=A2FQX0_TRIV3|nr:hypothetical protein TVAGG3_0959270 [Trichomonas vaginalis G3]EAX92709.1 hypothetical protein TVAG_148120 [Trichomonas vaginalis G3]KAI5487783.1 hypothetical protein TVAGG3_0959270 [Trichomonas vaginalis G3]|eukprot:XP_001305639.1 hypothetical protein [Trichomonas vaginalis G3]